MDYLAKIQQATLAARYRTGDASISTRADRGKIQAGRVTYDAAGVGQFAPITAWLPLALGIEALEALDTV